MVAHFGGERDFGYDVELVTAKGAGVEGMAEGLVGGSGGGGGAGCLGGKRTTACHG